MESNGNSKSQATKPTHQAIDLKQCVSSFVGGLRQRWEQRLPCNSRECSAKPRIEEQFQTVLNHTRQALDTHIVRPLNVGKNKVTETLSMVEKRLRGIESEADIVKAVSLRLNGIPVYTVSNRIDEVSLIADAHNQKSLGLFFFRKEDADSFLSQFTIEEPVLGQDAKVISVPLDKVYELQKQGITFRFLPDPNQVKHALKITSEDGSLGDYFPGVPVFQCNDLTLRNMDRRMHPVFFSKEDLEHCRKHALQAKRLMNENAGVSEVADIQVGSFEDIICKMEKSGSSSGWQDLVFVPPGFGSSNHLGPQDQR